MSAPLDEYLALLNYLSARSLQLEKSHQSHLRCGQGCHSCCLPGLTVNPVEAAALERWLRDHPEAAQRAYAVQQANPWSGQRCSFLDASGGCSVYEARPVVCRSHGLPLRFADTEQKEGGKRLTDACPLNFTDVDLESLEDAAVIDLDKLNTLLAAINLRFNADNASERTPLAPSSWLSKP